MRDKHDSITTSTSPKNKKMKELEFTGPTSASSVLGPGQDLGQGTDRAPLKAPSQDVTSNTPVQQGQTGAPSQGVSIQAPSQIVTSQGPAVLPQGVTDQAPSRDVTTETPVQQGLTGAPSQGVTSQAPSQVIISQDPSQVVTSLAPAQQGGTGAPSQEGVTLDGGSLENSDEMFLPDESRCENMQ